MNTDLILANVEAQRGIALFQHTRAGETADRLRQVCFVVVLGDEQTLIVEHG
jgi:hypothetical protein